MKPLVIYHADCTDGFGAAFAAWLKLGDEAEYRACAYGDDNPDIASCAGRDVFVLDFSFKRPLMDELFQRAKRVVWLDHHKTAFEMYGWSERGALCAADVHADARHFVDLDNSRSGALLAWEYFHPGTEVPMLIRHIDDRDRWQFKLDGSKNIHAFLSSVKPWSFAEWKTFYELRPETYLAMRVAGAAILRAQDQHVASMAKQARKCRITAVQTKIGEPLSAPFVCLGFGGVVGDTYEASGLACNATLHMSELGYVLATQSGTYALIWYVAADNKAKCSLRSNGDYDVSAIAKAFGGGGHRNAAGFETDIDTLMGWLK